jgi:hypothetical protein
VQPATTRVAYPVVAGLVLGEVVARWTTSEGKRERRRPVVWYSDCASKAWLWCSCWHSCLEALSPWGGIWWLPMYTERIQKQQGTS